MDCLRQGHYGGQASGTAVQLAKLITPIKALELTENREVSIDTYSKYAFLPLHDNSATWKQGKSLTFPK